MVIRFCIPNGWMEIDLDTFLPGAGKSQIRKMLKRLSHSWPNEEQVREIREWLEEQIRREKNEAARGSKASCKLVEKYICVLGYADKMLP
ncbi:hypothetical protein [Enterocloster clostridioformis]|uniref:hypothetical protein n=1 Tax=Enterocloster clostridioformis TaxID=1531 RepID=UPI0002D1791F|nr:hypothetical protein [Enterocloster clostridioformis]ENZ70354.1 hypothetical protein HMPREF1081_01858 [[Clostridium] clostridioforme 90A4]